MDVQRYRGVWTEEEGGRVSTIENGGRWREKCFSLLLYFMYHCQIRWERSENGAFWVAVW